MHQKALRFPIAWFPMKCTPKAMPGENSGLGTTTPNMTTAAPADSQGFPLSILWLPYVLLSLLLVSLMIVSFVHYHRKHGHKYHQRQALAQLSRTQQQPADSEALLAAPNEIKSHTTPTRGPLPDIQPDISQSKGRHHRHHKTTSEHDSHSAYPPPNGRLKSGGPEKEAAPTPRQPRQPGNPRVKQHCDEPSTSSSTVSSKESKVAAATVGRGRRHRNREPIVYEANENGSMVDVRVKTAETLSSAPPQIAANNPQRLPTVKENRGTGRKLPDIEALQQLQGVQKSKRPNYLPHRSRSMNQRDGMCDNYYDARYAPNQFYQLGHSLDRYDRHYPDYMQPVQYSPEHQPYRSRYSSAPQHTRPPPPRRDYYSVPFYPSGDMQMLSDTEGDEALLLQHTKL